MSAPTNGPGTNGRDVRDLLGAYALDAVDDVERIKIEHALDADPELRDEAKGLRRATALLHDADGPGSDVWSRIETRLADGSHRSPSVVPLATARRRRSRRTAVARVLVVAATAAALAGVTAWAATQQSGTDAPAPAPPAVPQVVQDARRAAGSPDAETIEIESVDGRHSADVVLRPGGRGYLLAVDLPRLGGPYSLYAIVSGTKVLLGQVRSTGDALAFRLPPGVETLVLEDASGATIASDLLAGREIVPPEETDASSPPSSTPGTPTTAASPGGVPLPTLPPAPQPPIELPTTPDGGLDIRIGTLALDLPFFGP